MNEKELKAKRQKITSVIRAFSMDPHNSPLKKQKDREIAGRFIDKLNSNTFDTGDLPYFSKDGLAKNRNKAECVLAMLCRTVVHYWNAAESRVGDETDYNFVLADDLCKLRSVHTKYESLGVLGDLKGYYLLESMRKDIVKAVKASDTIESHVRDMAQDHVDTLGDLDEEIRNNLPKLSGLEDDNETGTENTESDRVAD